SCIEQFLATIKAKTVTGEVQLQALVDGKKLIITESTVRRDLQLEDAKGVDCLPNAAIFEQLTLMRKRFFGRETPLFLTMMVQAQKEMGEGSANSINPHHIPTIIHPSTSQPQKKQKPRKTKRKNTELPKTSGHTTNIADKAVNKEMNQNLERATTTASSLEAKQDNVNINKTQSKATLNEPSSIGTSSENTKTTQAPKIDSLKRKVKKLEKKQRSRTHKLKRLHKVGLTTRVDSSNEASLCEDASKQERINDIDADEGITLVSTHDDAGMFDVDKDLHGEEVFVAKQDKNVVENEFDASEVQVSTTATTATISIDEVNLAQAFAELKHTIPNPMLKGLKNKDLQEIVLKKQEVNSDLIKEWNDIEAKIDDDYKLAERLQAEEQQELNDTKKATLFMKLLEKRIKFFAVKRAEEKKNKPPTRAQQRSIMVNTFVDYNTELLEESSQKAEAEVTERSSKRAGTELKQESSKKKKIDDDQETAELK
nr:hypothetical protein [Tanacetum cinerariifolium]